MRDHASKLPAVAQPVNRAPNEKSRPDLRYECG